jgi:hypothetical protein
MTMMMMMMMMMIIIMSMGWDYVSELLPLTGLLLITQVIYERGETRWNDIDSEKQIRPQSSLAILPAKSSSSKSGETWRRKWI